MILEFLYSLPVDGYWDNIYIVPSLKCNLIKTPKSNSHLILRANIFFDQILFNMYGLKCQPSFSYYFSLQGIKCMKQPYREGRT